MWFKHSLLVAASLLVGLLLIELMLRLLGWSFPLFAQPDAVLGWSFRPNVSGWSSHENTAHLRMNRFGFRGPDWTDAPAEDRYRIAVLGNSFVDSSNLADEYALTTIIEKSLGACPAFAKRRAEVLNFGVSGYGTGQEYLQLQRQVAALRPNLIVLAFYVGNDVMNNVRELSVKDQVAKPYFVDLPSGELQLDTSFLDGKIFRQTVAADWKKRLINQSYLLQAVKQMYLKRSVIPSPLEGPYKVDDARKKISRPKSILMFSPPENDIWRSAWTVTEKTLLRMRDWSQQHNVPFELVIIPAPIQALPGEDRRRAAIGVIKGDDLGYPVNRIAQFASQNGIPAHNLLEPFRDYGDRESVYLYGFPPSLGDGHLNATGNQVAGKSIADWLCQTTKP